MLIHVECLSHEINKTPPMRLDPLNNLLFLRECQPHPQIDRNHVNPDHHRKHNPKPDNIRVRTAPVSNAGTHPTQHLSIGERIVFVVRTPNLWQSEFFKGQDSHCCLRLCGIPPTMAKDPALNYMNTGSYLLKFFYDSLLRRPRGFHITTDVDRGT